VCFVYVHEIKQWNLSASVLGGVGKGMRGRDGGDEPTNVQCKAIQKCQNDSSLYN
jgi:hypothetical protein